MTVFVLDFLVALAGLYGGMYISGVGLSVDRSWHSDGACYL
jgi:hypothetical protein